MKVLIIFGTEICFDRITNVILRYCVIYKKSVLFYIAYT